MSARGQDRRGNLVGFVLYALATQGKPPLTQAELTRAIVAAFESPDGRSLADGLDLPSPELLGGLGEVIGAFGDWLRTQGIVEGCGFSRSGDALTCEFRACLCLGVVDRLRAAQPDAVPPCVVVGLLAAFFQARGIRAEMVSFRRTDEGCEWQFALRR